MTEPTLTDLIQTVQQLNHKLDTFHRRLTILWFALVIGVLGLLLSVATVVMIHS